MPYLPIKTYQCFSSLLEKRISTKQHLTEDSVRYSFFVAALQTTRIQPHEIVLELPHPKFEGKEIDTHISAADGRQESYIEFKFHRTSKSTSPKPQKAGSLFKDFSRLAAIKTKTSRCLVVYLTDSEMTRYFENNTAAYSSFWNTPCGGEFQFDEEFIAKATNTFRKSSGDLHRSRIRIEFDTKISFDHHLRIFEVTEL